MPPNGYYGVHFSRGENQVPECAHISQNSVNDATGFQMSFPHHILSVLQTSPSTSSVPGKWKGWSRFLINDFTDLTEAGYAKLAPSNLKQDPKLRVGLHPVAELFKWQPYSMKASAFPWYRVDCDQINSADIADTHVQGFSRQWTYLVVEGNLTWFGISFKYWATMVHTKLINL